MFIKKYHFIVLVLALCTCISACHRGTDSLPKLSNLLFKAIKEDNFKGIVKLTPNKSQIEKYLELFELNQFKDSNKRKDEAGSREETLLLTLKNELMQIRNTSKIDWATSSLQEYQYEENDTKEGYKKALGFLKIKSSAGIHTIGFDAKKVNGIWFLAERLEIVANLK